MEKKTISNTIKVKIVKKSCKRLSEGANKNRTVRTPNINILRLSLIEK